MSNVVPRAFCYLGAVLRLGRARLLTDGSPLASTAVLALLAAFFLGHRARVR